MHAQANDRYLANDFALEHGLDIGDVQDMIGLTIVEFSDSLDGRQVLFARGYTAAQAKNAYGLVRRAGGTTIASRSIARQCAQLV